MATTDLHRSPRLPVLLVRRAAEHEALPRKKRSVGNMSGRSGRNRSEKNKSENENERNNSRKRPVSRRPGNKKN
jgi:hypothetical protein